MLLFLFVAMMTDKQEVVEPQNAMPQMRVSCYVDAEQATTARTLEHLYTERLAMPVCVTGELPGYHPTHSKPKCLQSTHRANSNSSFRSEIVSYFPHRMILHSHVIDYYIYTLEHIII